MKYELEPFHRNISNKSFLDDLRRVALKLDKNSLSTEEYNKNGKYHSSTLRNRFGSWTSALNLAGLKLRKHAKINKKELLNDLKRVANIVKKKSITQNEYESTGVYSSSPFIRTFGSWFNALEKAGLEKTRTYGVTDEEYFENLENIWTKLGRQPKIANIKKPFSKYCAAAYQYKYGSWRKALEAFVKNINDSENIEEISVKNESTTIVPKTNNIIYEHKTKRNIPWRLRFKIMKRDNFKCKICGRSPASDNTVVLHVDHIHPYSKGGETVIDNLQTLCSKCNLGKSDITS